MLKNEASGTNCNGKPIVTFSLVIDLGIELSKGINRFSSPNTTATLDRFLLVRLRSSNS